MRTPDTDLLIVGAGLAAQRCAETLRQLGHDERIVIVGEEDRAPYDRPPLSKDVLTGKRDPASLSLRPDGWHADHAVELVHGTACGLDAREHIVTLAGGAALRYRRLLIATGSAPRRLDVLPPGDAVHELRTATDAARLRDVLRAGSQRLAIIGAGLIGLEVASSARALGLNVTLVEAAATPLARVLPPSLGQWIAALHRRANVDVKLATAVRLVRSRVGGVRLKLSDGSVVGCAAVLVATGTSPATAWCAGAGVGPGQIATDAGGRSPLPDVYVAGDAACFPDPAGGRPRPTPHWEAAARQGAAVARSMLGAAVPAGSPPMFWSDQHGVRIQFVGHAAAGDRIRMDGSPEASDFTAWLHRDGRPVAAMLAGRPGLLAAVRRTIADPDAHETGRRAERRSRPTDLPTRSPAPPRPAPTRPEGARA